jgi:DNA-binding HxlR family transcriptional regulator
MRASNAVPGKDILRVDESNSPVRFAVGLIGGKWKPVILHYLKSRAIRFGELRRLIPNASHKVLTQQLRELERDRIIERSVFEGKVKRVEYSYSEFGLTLEPILSALEEWGIKYRTSKEASSPFRFQAFKIDNGLEGARSAWQASQDGLHSQNVSKMPVKRDISLNCLELRKLGPTPASECAETSSLRSAFSHLQDSL